VGGAVSRNGTLRRYDDASYIRAATAEEKQQSEAQARKDGGAGVISVSGKRCYVEPAKPRGGARPGAGRKPGSARSGLRRTLLLSHEAIAVLEAVPERQRGAWVSALIEAAQRERQ